ncbi:TRAP transporter substrate-binding protein [Marinibaculum pumilum]|uniref:TRAP transporter substrate-binding protein n=1 Tax=Marinibaculum pumilum TaxID=1766165 RepID=A0ABV7KX74_9PROT
MSKIVIRALLAAVVLAAALPAASGAAAPMKLASATINDVQHQWQKLFAAELTARVGDRLDPQIFPSSQLGSIPRMAEGVLLGTIEAFTTPTAFVTTIDPRFQAFDVPGLFQDPQEVARALQDPAYRDRLETLFLDKGLRVIGAFYNSPTVVFTTRPVTALADFKGLKIRTFASPMQVKPMELLGAAPLPLALSEVVPQLQNGGIDGMLVGMPILTAFKFYDIGRDVTDLRFAEIVSVTLVNEAWFQAQPPEVRAAIVDAGRAADQAAFPWGVENVARSYAAWRDHGGLVHELPPGQQARLENEFAALAAELVAANPAVQQEYERLKALVEGGAQ